MLPAAPESRAPASAVWALGLTQIVGYGTLFYSFAILADAIAVDLATSREWVFGALSGALFLGSLLAPAAGRLADSLGAGRVMVWGSAAAAVSLAAAGLAPERLSFAVALVAMELASCFVLYSTAFVALVQIGPLSARRSITHLTLIAGFASTLFWPLSTVLHAHLTWREVYLAFAALNLLLCLPIHAWLARLAMLRKHAAGGAAPAAVPVPAIGTARPRLLLGVMMAAFALQGLVLSAVLLHMVPLLSALGLGTAGVAAATLFGPAQVASRLINMLFGARLPQARLAVVAALFLTAALVVLWAAAPAVAGIAAFVILFGLGSGLMSIVGGTLPLEIFGSASYGRNVGWLSGARQFSAAFAPFAFALLLARTGVSTSLGALVAGAAGCVALFTVVALMARPQRSSIK